MSRLQRLWTLGLALAAAMAIEAGVSSQSTDPLSGTWRLDLAKSQFNPASLAPKSGTTKFEVTKGAVKTITDGVDSQGRKTHSEYTATLDGKDSVWKGTIDGRPNTDQDAVAWKKIDEYTYEVVSKLKGQVLTTQRTVIARDGKSRTNTVTGKNAQGQTINHTVVYERQ